MEYLTDGTTENSYNNWTTDGGTTEIGNFELSFSDPEMQKQWDKRKKED